jgi:hypothetical protein
LLGLAVSLDASDLVRVSVRSLVLASLRLIRAAVAVPAFVLRPLAPLGHAFRVDRARPVLRTIAIAAPVVLLFALLLGSADRVFADVITPPLPHWNLSNAFGHVTLALVGAFVVGTLWRTAVAPRWFATEDVPSIAAALPRVGNVQWTAALGGVVSLFTVFVVVQLAFLFGGRQRVLVTPGLTYAEYARSGFFQLIAVAVLTVGLVVAAWDVGERTSERRFRVLTTGMIGLAFVILASAFMRLRLYERTFGFTIARFFAYVAIAWIAVVFVALLVCVWRGRREHFGSAALAAALVALLAINVVNPERFVAERNVARFHAMGRIDTYYLGSVLGLEAAPVAVRILPELPRPDAVALRDMLCAQRLASEGEPGWRSANLGRAAAWRALDAAGLTAAACGSSGSLAG